MGALGISLSPIMSYYITSDTKFYIEADAIIGQGVVLYESLGIGKEYFYKEILSVEPFLLLNLGVAFTTSPSFYTVYGTQGILRLNFIPFEFLKIFIETGVEFDLFHSFNPNYVNPLDFPLRIIPMIPIKIGISLRF